MGKIHKVGCGLVARVWTIHKVGAGLVARVWTIHKVGAGLVARVWTIHKVGAGLVDYFFSPVAQLPFFGPTLAPALYCIYINTVL